ncbi:hypothetical protein [Actinomadura roseirufa]|uniref:hypothetical protein n=1 Tax=Actinomadura roseirufa TaxID=2094049 RepID=UPI001041A5E8|nr:hypothetical protein [Actinomadura roseirufa]
MDFCRDYIGTGPYAAIWARHFNEGGTQDVIWQDDVNDGPRRFCRYGLDEVRVVAADEGRLPACVADADGGPPRTPGEPWRRDPDGSWRRRVAGSYRAGNDRSAEVGADATPATVPPEPEPADRALATPTTPNLFGDEPTRVDPPWLASLTEGRSGAALVDWYHR